MKNVVYLATPNIYEDMVTAAKSLLANNKIDHVYFLTEHDQFPEKLPHNIRTINVKGQNFFKKDGPNYNFRLTYMVMMKCALPYILSDVDKILCLDCDTIVIDDISGVWDQNIDDHYFAACLEPNVSKIRGTDYYNFGSVYLNLEKLRKDMKALEAIDILNSKKYDFTEQDVMNIVCKDHILEMSSEYNVCNYTKRTDHPRIIHYAGRNDWRDKPLVTKYKNIEWEDIL